MVLSYPIRSESAGVIGQEHYWYKEGAPVKWNIFARTKSVAGENFSISHTPDRDGIYRTGGPWVMYQRTSEHSAPKTTAFRRGYDVAYKGRFYIRDEDEALLGFDNLSKESYQSIYDDAWRYGSKAWAKLKPDQPDFNAVTSLAELRELTPRLKEGARDAHRKWRKFAKKRRINPKKWDTELAKQYIEYNFAWLPLVSDVISFTSAFQGRKDRFDQLLKDESKPVRRRGHIEVDIDEDYQTPYSYEFDSGGHNPHLKPLLVTQCYASTAQGGYHTTAKQRRHRTRVWCEGRSRYLLPPGPRDEAWKRKIYRRIMGGKISPYQLYNIIPWSWFVDYFSGLGDFMNAVSAGIADRVYFDYAYVMKHTIREHRARCGQAHFITKWGPYNYYTDLVVRDETKCRVPASPFGFGLELPTPKQMSMLGALGYSRLP